MRCVVRTPAAGFAHELAAAYNNTVAILILWADRVGLLRSANLFIRPLTWTVAGLPRTRCHPSIQ